MIDLEENRHKLALINQTQSATIESLQTEQSNLLEYIETLTQKHREQQSENEHDVVAEMEVSRKLQTKVNNLDERCQQLLSHNKVLESRLSSLPQTHKPILLSQHSQTTPQ